MLYPLLRFILGCLTMISFQWVEAQQGLSVNKVGDHSWVFTTSRMLGSTLFPSNGMFVIDDGKALIIDTPWDTTQFQALIDTLTNLGATPMAVVATHFHDDRTAGLNYYRSKGILTYSSQLTRTLCLQSGENTAEITFQSDTTWRIGKVKVSTFFPGAGHSPDNLVIYVENDGILFGGCLIKSYESAGLGNLSDANLDSWPLALQAVMDRFGNARAVIPGHQDWKQPTSIRHSLLLLRTRPSQK